MGQFYRYDGIEPKPITKAEIRQWCARVREDLRDFADAIARDDLDAARAFAYDAAGAADELQSIADATLEAREEAPA